MTDFIPKILSPVASLLFGKPKAPKPQVIAPTPTRNDAAELARQEDAQRRRQGALANNITGGAEAVTPGGKTLLGPN